MGGRTSASNMGSQAFKSTQDMDYLDGTGEAVYVGEDDATPFFMENTNMNELIESMGEDALSAFESWVGGEWMSRDNWAPFNQRSSYIQEDTRLIDNVLDSATLSKSVTVNRMGSARFLGLGARVEDPSQLDSLVGKSIKSSGYMSTGAAAQGLVVERGHNVEYRIHIPGGSKGAGMYIGDKRVNPHWGSRQREFIVNRDSVFKIKGYKRDSSRGVYMVDIEYTGRDRHDYGEG